MKLHEVIMRFTRTRLPFALALLAIAALLPACEKPPAPARDAAPQTDAEPAVQGRAFLEKPASRPAPPNDNAVDSALANRPQAPANADVDKMTRTPEATNAGDDRYKAVGFDVLAGFEYQPSETMGLGGGTMPNDAEPGEAAIPDAIKALDGKPIAVTGFMVPIDLRDGKVRYFLLVRNQMLCCYGVMPSMNEWIHVEMNESNRVEYVNDVPITVKGKLAVGEEIEDGVVMSLYRMNGDSVTPRGGW